MIAGWVPIPIETLGWLGGLEYLLGYGKKTMLLSFQSLDIPRRFCHRIAMTSWPITGPSRWASASRKAISYPWGYIMRKLSLIVGIVFLNAICVCNAKTKYDCRLCKDTGLLMCGECKGVGLVNICKYDWCPVKKCNALDHRQKCSVMYCIDGSNPCGCKKGTIIFKRERESRKARGLSF
jgi:hypothetical protein